MATIRITPALALDERDLQETFVRSPGPGGQNVNKVSTAVQLRFALEQSADLTAEVRRRLRALAGRRVTADGWLVIEANRFRSQARNREDARARLVELVRKAAHPPKPRRPTRPSVASKERRLRDKRARARTKLARGRSALDQG
ncbi:MAG TPA: alternative ribosome rescue aminoacyl-tRNA hydrolase ArfB [Burkholderiales bacterium]|nr:alternative ribosome rescue aminoacyl-tRNA hydrolase ArfB [Burkholderiales bacterium]